MLFGHLYVFFGEMSIQIFCLFFYLFVCLFSKPSLHPILVFFLNLFLKYNCFTTLCQFLLCSTVNQYKYTYIRISSPSFLEIYLFIYLFLVVLRLCCCKRAFSSCSEQGLLFAEVCGLLIAMASLVVEHGLQVRRLQWLWHAGSVVAAHGLQSTGSVVVVHGLSCSVACGIFLDQGSNPCPLHWQADS